MLKIGKCYKWIHHSLHLFFLLTKITTNDNGLVRMSILLPDGTKGFITRDIIVCPRYESEYICLSQQHDP